jgi:hypothetical protein
MEIHKNMGREFNFQQQWQHRKPEKMVEKISDN